MIGGDDGKQVEEFKQKLEDLQKENQDYKVTLKLANKEIENL